MLLLNQRYECVRHLIHNSKLPPLSFKRRKSNSPSVKNHPHCHCQPQRFNWKIFTLMRRRGSRYEDLVNEIEIVSVSSFARWLDNSGRMKLFTIFILGLGINFFSKKYDYFSFWPDFQISHLPLLFVMWKGKNRVKVDSPPKSSSGSYLNLKFWASVWNFHRRGIKRSFWLACLN